MCHHQCQQGMNVQTHHEKKKKKKTNKTFRVSHPHLKTMSSLVKLGCLVLPSNMTVIYVIVLQLPISSLDELNRIAIQNYPKQ